MSTLARTAPDTAGAIVVQRVKLDALARRLWAVHAQLGDVPLADLELTCSACGTGIHSAGSRLVVDAVLALESVIADLLAAGR